MHQAAPLWTCAQRAVAENEVGAVRGYQVCDLDIKYVQCAGELFERCRREHESKRRRGRLFGRQLWVATQYAVVLSGGVSDDVTVLCRGEPRVRALRCREEWHIPVRAEVRTPVQNDLGWPEQLLDIGCAHGALVTRTQAHVFGRRPLHSEFVGVRRETLAVIRVAIPRVGTQAVRETRIVDQRNAQLTEKLPHAEPPVDGQYRARACNVAVDV